MKNFVWAILVTSHFLISSGQIVAQGNGGSTAAGFVAGAVGLGVATEALTYAWIDVEVETYAETFDGAPYHVKNVPVIYRLVQKQALSEALTRDELRTFYGLAVKARETLAEAEAQSHFLNPKEFSEGLQQRIIEHKDAIENFNIKIDAFIQHFGAAHANGERPNSDEIEQLSDEALDIIKIAKNLPEVPEGLTHHLINEIDGKVYRISGLQLSEVAPQAFRINLENSTVVSDLKEALLTISEAVARKKGAIQIGLDRSAYVNAILKKYGINNLTAHDMASGDTFKIEQSVESSFGGRVYAGLQAIIIDYPFFKAGLNAGPIANEAYQAIYAYNKEIDKALSADNPNFWQRLFVRPFQAQRWQRMNHANLWAQTGNATFIFYLDDLFTPVIQSAKFDPSEFIAANAVAFKTFFHSATALYGAPSATDDTGVGSYNVGAQAAADGKLQADLANDRETKLRLLKSVYDQLVSVEAGPDTLIDVQSIKDVVSAAAKEIRPSAPK